MRRHPLLALLILLAAAPSALADSWPSKPIKAVVPFGAGSATDIIPRIVFEQLQSQLGQTIVVDNREYGFNWRGDRGSLGGSYYDSRSPFGTSLAVGSR